MYLKIANSYSYRFAEAVMRDESFIESFLQIKEIIGATEVPLLDPHNLNGSPKHTKMKHRKRNGPCFFLPVNQIKLNDSINKLFVDKGWVAQNKIVDPTKYPTLNTGLKGDFKNGRLHVEVQFGNMARWYTDVFKFQLSYSLDDIDVAVLIVPMQRLANLIDENVVHFERVSRELPAAKMSLTLPILVIGVEPRDYSPIQDCYETATENWRALQESHGNANASVVPFSARIRQQDDSWETSTVETEG